MPPSAWATGAVEESVFRAADDGLAYQAGGSLQFVSRSGMARTSSAAGWGCERAGLACNWRSCRIPSLRVGVPGFRQGRPAALLRDFDRIATVESCRRIVRDGGIGRAYGRGMPGQFDPRLEVTASAVELQAGPASDPLRVLDEPLAGSRSL